MELKTRNVNGAFSEIFWRLKSMHLTPEPTRNGPAIVYPDLVTTTYYCPQERVLFHAGRDANPIFHLMESIWMLAGRQDVGFLTQFNKRMGDFSDDGKTFNAPYGYRWRHHFGHDQLQEIIELIRKEPTTRQAVLQIWDNTDLTKSTKDKACNTQVVFDVRDNYLNMTVFNRSNDIWWGAYGANAVHFSILQEFIAAATNHLVGVYRQVSNNFHLYTELYNAEKYLISPPSQEEYDYYTFNQVTPIPLMLTSDYKRFLMECEQFCSNPFDENARYVNPFFNQVAHPMAMVSKVRKEKSSTGQYYADKIQAQDWRIATHEWIERREKAKENKDKFGY